MNASTSDKTISRIAAAIGEPARVRMLYCLLDGKARTGTELAAIGEVGPSTASVHLSRLLNEKLVKVFRQGRHRYYSLAGPQIARALETLNVVAAGSQNKFVPGTPSTLLAARSCYDHIAGALGVALHDRFRAMKWLIDRKAKPDGYDLSLDGEKAVVNLGGDVAGARLARRKFAYPCLDWSERRPHIGGALGAALLTLALRRKWVTQELHSRALILTSLGQREVKARLGVHV